MPDTAAGTALPALLLASAAGLCPHCQARTLFAGPLRFADCCAVCGLDYRCFNVGDGPAAFLTMIVGTLILIPAMLLEFSVHPPLWLHMLLWTPCVVLAVTGALRLAKAALLILEYRNQAREGRLVPRAEPRA